MPAPLQSIARNEPHPYVHKLRLEAQEGGNVEIPTRLQSSSRLALATIGAVAAVSAGLWYYANL